MNLGGWDTMSASAIPLINAGLAASTIARDTTFSFVEAGLSVEGTFGPWRILEGGSLQLLQMAIPIVEGRLTGLGPEPQALDGLELIVEVALRLLPNQTGDAIDLVFAFESQTESGLALSVLHVVDPKERFPHIGNALVQQTLAQALNANVAGVAQVLATIPSRGATKTWLATPYVDWANVVLGDGRQYLAIFGALRKPTAKMGLDKVDPKLFSGNGSAYFAASRVIFNERLMAPYLSANFRPKTKFKAVGGGNTVRAARFLLPAPKKIERLTISTLEMVLAGGGLRCKVNAVARLKAANLHLQLTMLMPFSFSRKGGKIGFSPDKNPKIKHWTKPRKDVDIFMKSIGFLVTALVVELAKKSIYGLVRGIATRMQNINAPAKMPASWIGLRDFEASQARLGSCFWFRDDRPL